MPLDVAMEEPYAWIVGLKTDHGVAVRVYHDGISSYRGAGDIAGISTEGSGLWGRSFDDLEIVPVEMPWV